MIPNEILRQFIPNSQKCRSKYYYYSFEVVCRNEHEVISCSVLARDCIDIICTRFRLWIKVFLLFVALRNFHASLEVVISIVWGSFGDTTHWTFHIVYYC